MLLSQFTDIVPIMELVQYNHPLYGNVEQFYSLVNTMHPPDSDRGQRIRKRSDTATGLLRALVVEDELALAANPEAVRIISELLN